MPFFSKKQPTAPPQQMFYPRDTRPPQHPPNDYARPSPPRNRNEYDEFFQDRSPTYGNGYPYGAPHNQNYGPPQNWGPHPNHQPYPVPNAPSPRRKSQHSPKHYPRHPSPGAQKNYPPPPPPPNAGYNHPPPYGHPGPFPGHPPLPYDHVDPYQPPFPQPPPPMTFAPRPPSPLQPPPLSFSAPVNPPYVSQYPFGGQNSLALVPTGRSNLDDFSTFGASYGVGGYNPYGAPAYGIGSLPTSYAAPSSSYSHAFDLSNYASYPTLQRAQYNVTGGLLFSGQEYRGPTAAPTYQMVNSYLSSPTYGDGVGYAPLGGAVGGQGFALPSYTPLPQHFSGLAPSYTQPTFGGVSTTAYTAQPFQQQIFQSYGAAYPGSPAPSPYANTPFGQAFSPSVKTFGADSPAHFGPQALHGPTPYASPYATPTAAGIFAQNSTPQSANLGFTNGSGSSVPTVPAQHAYSGAPAQGWRGPQGVRSPSPMRDGNPAGQPWAQQPQPSQPPRLGVQGPVRTPARAPPPAPSPADIARESLPKVN